MGKERDARCAVLGGAGLGLALGAALWTKMPALFILPFPLLCALLLSKRGRVMVPARGFAVAGAIVAVAATLLFLAPHAGSLWDKAQGFTEPPQVFLTYLPGRLESNLLRYWSWLYAYLPTPLWGLALVAAVWGLARRTRLALLLLGCWAAFTMPTMLWSRGEMFQSRYVSQGIFPLLLLVAALMVASWDALWSRRRSRWQRLAALRPVGQLAASTLFLVLIGPTLWFDVQLLNRPESAPLPPTDRFLFVTSFDSGYGFKEAVQLVRQRAIELTRNGQPVIVLGNYYFGHTYDGLKIYLRGVPGVFQYVDSHMARDPEGFIAAWKSHRVPILLVGNDGLDRLDAFEKAVPRAKRLGFFPKPTGQSSFRVYEVDVADLGP
jgi:4-amino-4-deoxy-L-arabinose transferase-like glycosyltransferase